MASSKIKGKAEFVNYSFDVKVEGKNVPRLGDMMVQNCGSPANTPPMPEVQPPLIIVEIPAQDHQAECMQNASDSGSPFVESVA